MVGGPQGIPGEREGIHAAARRVKPPEARVALGKSRQALCFRRTERRRIAGRSVLRTQPVDGVSFHARPRMEGGLPELLIHRRSLRWPDDSFSESRCDAGGGLSRATE